MKAKFVLENFDQYVESFYGSLNEASKEDLGFAAILGSTDKQNLGEASSKIGIKKNANYTVKIKNIQDLVDLGTKKTFEGFTGLVKGDAVGDKIDFITITSKGETKEIAQKVSAAGNIILNFDDSGMEIKAANNGMLALMRACVAASQVFGKGGVDPQKVDGKFLISMGNPISDDSSRNAAFLAVSTDITAESDLRISSEFLDFWEPKIQSQPDKFLKFIGESIKTEKIYEEESMDDGSSLIRLVGDSLADCIRAASYQWDQPRSFYVNDSGCYRAFKELYQGIRKEARNKKMDIKGKNKDFSELVLAMMMQTTIKKIGTGYPMKIANIDMVPVAKEILSQVSDPKSKTLKHGPIEDLLAKFAPETYPNIPQFNPILGDFWKSITASVIMRTASTFSTNDGDPDENVVDAPGSQVSGEEKSGSKKNISGGV